MLATRGMFDGATSFNGDLSSWDVSSVTNMGCASSSLLAVVVTRFLVLSSWDVSSVTDMRCAQDVLVAVDVSCVLRL